MKTRRLGSDGPDISVIGFGAWEAGGMAWGPNPPDDQTIEAMHVAFDNGMNWIDTAEVYGRGRSEELVGQAAAGRRAEVLLFTKVAPRPEGSGFKPDQVKQAIRGSLRRLGTDYVDLYQLHWPDDEVPLEDTWGAMAQLVDEGVARHIGVSNFTSHMVERCLPIRHVACVQNQLSLLHQEDRAHLLPRLERLGVGYLAYSPLAYGLLTGAIGSHTRFDPRDWRSGRSGQGQTYARLFAPGRLEEHVERVDRLRSIAGGLGTAVAPLALRWVIEQPGVTAAIAGSRNADHVRSNAAAGDLRLDRATLARIDEAFT